VVLKSTESFEQRRGTSFVGLPKKGQREVQMQTIKGPINKRLIDQLIEYTRKSIEKGRNMKFDNNLMNTKAYQTLENKPSTKFQSTLKDEILENTFDGISTGFWKDENASGGGFTVF
jgi:hypothetical protein